MLLNSHDTKRKCKPQMLKQKTYDKTLDCALCTKTQRQQNHWTQHSAYNITHSLRNAQDPCMMDVASEIERLKSNP